MKIINFRTQGMTLLELTIAMAILAVLVVISLSTSRQMSTASGLESQISESRKIGDDMVRVLTNSLQPAMLPVFNLAGDNQLTYLEPVDFDNDGDTLNADLKIEWGAIRPDQTGINRQFQDKGWVWNDTLETWQTVTTEQTFTTTIRFAKTSSFSEATKNIDLNHDGDLADVFAIGRLERVYSAGRVLGDVWQEEVVVPLCAERLVQLEGDPRGDIDGNGVPDPLFLMTGSYLQITMFLTGVNSEQPLLTKVTAGVEMRNM